MGSPPAITFYYFGHEKCKKNHFYGPTVRAHYLVHFVIQGKGSYQVRGAKYQIQKDQAFLIRPDELTYYQADQKDPWEYCWIAFDGPEADRIVSHFFPSKETYICDATNPDLFNSYLAQTIPNFKMLNLSQFELAGWFYLLFSCLQPRTLLKRDREKEYLDMIVNYVKYNYMLNENIQEISTKIGIDRTYLYKILKKYKGCSPKEYLMLQKISAAKELLLYSEIPITEIGFLCGFNDSSSFCKNFRKYENISPSEYRRLIQNEVEK